MSMTLRESQRHFEERAKAAKTFNPACDREQRAESR